MQSRGIRVATVTISLLGVLAVGYLFGLDGVFAKKRFWGELVLGSLFFNFPSDFWRASDMGPPSVRRSLNASHAQPRLSRLRHTRSIPSGTRGPSLRGGHLPA